MSTLNVFNQSATNNKQVARNYNDKSTTSQITKNNNQDTSSDESMP
jgi:hypothetical protein